ncbi:hypothetical protein GCM10010387_34810 [Streptomyces inusitatus]|uniref:Uncharacterized protein n=1 Tax=Streptomyces inusitatus TaxID=68221 RepID=A0A918QAI2_9ACTN|nr:hypothetical protein GCM10010387_34810 [Streptomyces inusitatus]
MLEGVVEQLLGGEGPFGIRGQGLEESVVLGVVEQPAPHAGEVAQGDPVPVGDAQDIVADRVVEADFALVD